MSEYMDEELQFIVENFELSRENCDEVSTYTLTNIENDVYSRLESDKISFTYVKISSSS